MKKKLVFLVMGLVLCSFVVVFAASEKEEAATAEKAKEYEIVYVAKLIGIPWFNITEDGMKDAAAKLGNVKAHVVGAPDPDPAQQARIVEDMVAKGVDAICVVPNDAETVEPAMKKAKEAGIVVLTHESEKSRNNDYDIEMVDIQALGARVMEKMIDFTGVSKGGYAVMVGGLTVPTHNAWADAGVAWQEKNYPDFYQVTDRIPCTESVELSHDRTLELIKAYPDLKGLAIYGSLGGIGAAQALREKNMTDKISVVCTSLPSQSAQYLEDGSMDWSVLYSPYDCGVTVVNVAHWLLEGKDLKDMKEISGVGGFRLDGKIIVVEGLIDINKENVASYGF
jgi:simple sugar transport system substrate-binding protein